MEKHMELNNYKLPYWVLYRPSPEDADYVALP